MKLERESDYDLRYNISALIICILREDIKTPEQAFAFISNDKMPKASTEEWVRLREDGLSCHKIANIFGVYPSTVHYRLKRYYEKQREVNSQ